MKIAFLYDTLYGKGGAERVIIELANYLNADIITAGFNPKLREWINIRAKIVDIGNFSIRYNLSIGTLLEAPIRFFLNKGKFDYDIFIFSGQSSIFSQKNGKKNIWFCHTPNRILYDLRQKKLEMASTLRKILLKLYIWILYKKDQQTIKQNVQEIVVNSKNVQKRVNKYYQRSSMVLYPPVETKQFKFRKFGDFYLAVSRLFPEKRIDLIAKAFTKMPYNKLIIVGDGPEKDKILEIVKDNPNIRLFVNVNDKELIRLYSDCIATIYMPLDEDFGLIPLEGMASGKPCIAVNKGGCKETVINNKTGFLINANEEEIIEAIKKLDITLAKKMKMACITQAKKFDIEKCIVGWKRILDKNYNVRSKNEPPKKIQNNN